MMRLRQRVNVWSGLAGRLDGLHGNLVDQLTVDLLAADTERRPLPRLRVRYVPLMIR